jgi:hypothetical protein
LRPRAIGVAHAVDATSCRPVGRCGFAQSLSSRRIDAVIDRLIAHLFFIIHCIVHPSPWMQR